jgi:CheY-like chemotaxis protein
VPTDSGGGPRALWVDDSDSDRLLLQIAAEATPLEGRLDVESTYAGGVRQAMAAADAGAAYPLIIVDMKLGARDGADLIAELCASGVGDDVEFIVLTGSNDPHDLDKIAGVGARFARKPTLFDDWRALVAEFVRSLPPSTLE